MEQMVEPQGEIMALEMPGRIECLEGETEAGVISTASTLRWNS